MKVKKREEGLDERCDLWQRKAVNPVDPAGRKLGGECPDPLSDHPPTSCSGSPWPSPVRSQARELTDEKEAAEADRKYHWLIGWTGSLRTLNPKQEEFRLYPSGKEESLIMFGD